MDLEEIQQFASNIKANVSNVDWAALEQALGGLAENALKPVIDGEAEDLKTFGALIAKDMVAAIVAGNVGFQKQLQGQLKVLAEIARVRANAADWTFAEQALGFVFHALLIGVGAATPKA